MIDAKFSICSNISTPTAFSSKGVLMADTERYEDGSSRDSSQAMDFLSRLVEEVSPEAPDPNGGFITSGRDQYHIDNADYLGLDKSWLEMTKATIDVVLMFAHEMIKAMKTEAELRSFEPLYRKVLREPNKYVGITLEGPAVNSQEFIKVLKEYGVSAKAFETLDNTLLIKREDYEEVQEIIDLCNEKGVVEHNADYMLMPDGSMLSDPVEVFGVPTVFETKWQNSYGDTLDKDGNPVLNPKVDGNKEERLAECTRYSEYVKEHQGEKFKRTKYENYVPEQAMGLNGSYYTENVINWRYEPSGRCVAENTQPLEKEVISNIEPDSKLFWHLNERGNFVDATGHIYPRQNQNGDYIDENGDFHIKDEESLSGEEYQKRCDDLQTQVLHSKDQLTSSERNCFIMTEQGNFVHVDSLVAGENGLSYSEKDVLHVFRDGQTVLENGQIAHSQDEIDEWVNEVESDRKELEEDLERADRELERTEAVADDAESDYEAALKEEAQKEDELAQVQQDQAAAAEELQEAEDRYAEATDNADQAYQEWEEASREAERAEESYNEAQSEADTAREEYGRAYEDEQRAQSDYTEAEQSYSDALGEQLAAESAVQHATYSEADAYAQAIENYDGGYDSYSPDYSGQQSAESGQTYPGYSDADSYQADVYQNEYAQGSDNVNVEYDSSQNNGYSQQEPSSETPAQEYSSRQEENVTQNNQQTDSKSPGYASDSYKDSGSEQQKQNTGSSWGSGNQNAASQAAYQASGYNEQNSYASAVDSAAQAKEKLQEKGQQSQQAKDTYNAAQATTEQARAAYESAKENVQQAAQNVSQATNKRSNAFDSLGEANQTRNDAMSNAHEKRMASGFANADAAIANRDYERASRATNAAKSVLDATKAQSAQAANAQQKAAKNLDDFNKGTTFKVNGSSGNGNVTVANTGGSFGAFSGWNASGNQKSQKNAQGFSGKYAPHPAQNTGVQKGNSPYTATIGVQAANQAAIRKQQQAAKKASSVKSTTGASLAFSGRKIDFAGNKYQKSARTGVINKTSRRMQVAFYSSMGTLLASGGKGDPALEQARAFKRSMHTMHNVLNVTPLIGKGGVRRSLQRRANKQMRKVSSAQLNTIGRNLKIKNFARGGKLTNADRRKLLKELERKGVIERGIGKNSFARINKKKLKKALPGLKKDEINALASALHTQALADRYSGAYRQSMRELKSMYFNSMLQDQDARTVLRRTNQMFATSARLTVMAAGGAIKGLKAVHNRVGMRGRWQRHQDKVKKYSRQQKKYQAKAAKHGKNSFRGQRAQKKADKYAQKVQKNLKWHQEHSAKYGAARTRDKFYNKAANAVKAAPGKAAAFAGNQIKKPVRAVANRLANTRMVSGLRRGAKFVAGSKFGRTVGMVGRIGGGAVKKAFGFGTGFYKIVRTVLDIGNVIRALIREMIEKIIRFILGLFIKYIILPMAIFLFAICILGMCLNVLSMSISNAYQAVVGFFQNAIETVTTPAGAGSIAGIVYEEIRFMEIDWASEIRSYGTAQNAVAIDGLDYTNSNITLEEYLNSTAGVKDLLGAYAEGEAAKTSYEMDSMGTVTVVEKNEQTGGMQGPQPFEGAYLKDYKLIVNIDGGNVLELVGKPMEGWTSNAKEVTAMAVVFYNQSIESLKEASEDLKGLKGLFADVLTIFHGVGELLAQWDVPIIGWIANGTDWSYSGMFRTYAYPISINSRYENYYLSSYIFPTYWSSRLSLKDGEPGTDTEFEDDNGTDAAEETGRRRRNSKYVKARFDKSQENKKANAGDVAVEKPYWNVKENTTKAHDGELGISKYGGSGKVDTKDYVSQSTWGSLGDANYVGFNTCHDAMVAKSGAVPYGYYGCMMRYTFSYKWYGKFGTDEEGKKTAGAGITELHYGDADSWAEKAEDNTAEGEIQYDEENNGVEYYKYGQDVSQDVAPYKETDDEENGYNKDACTVHPLKLTDIGWSCWVFPDGYDNDWDIPTRELEDKNFDSPIGQALVFAGWKIDRIEPTEQGFYLYTFDPDSEDENGYCRMARFEFIHDCTEKHAGYYCGGHAQLRTRGIIMGLSKEQLTDGELPEREGTSGGKTLAKSDYDPKYLDPDTESDPDLYGDAEDVRGEAIHAFDLSTDTSAEVTTPTLLEEDWEYVKSARDLYDIDVLITRPVSSYISSSLIEPWKGWTLTNMGNVTTLINQDWMDAYQVTDTQTMVGGQTTGDGANALDSDSRANVLSQIGWYDVESGLDIANEEEVAELADRRSYPITTESGISIGSIKEEVEYINRLRHVKYALSLVGKVGYSQRMHDYLWGDLTGHQTDCSGFVSNIWRDALDLKGTVGAWNTVRLHDEAEGAGAWHDGLDGIEPGDIIVKDYDDEVSAHALIYVGEIDAAKIYSDRSEEGGQEVLESATHKYAVDCSSMTITTETYQDNAPSKVAEILNGSNTIGDYISNTVESFAAMFGKTHEPGNGVAKARSGNVRFSSRLESYSEDANIGYIDVMKLGESKGAYSWSGNALQAKNGTFIDNFENLLYANSDGGTSGGSIASDATEANESTGGLSMSYLSNSETYFWDVVAKDQSIGKVRNTVSISNDKGTPEKAAEKTTYTAPGKIDNNASSSAAAGSIYNLPDGNIKEQIEAIIAQYRIDPVTGKVSEDGQLVGWGLFYESGKFYTVAEIDGRSFYYELQITSTTPYSDAKGAWSGGSQSSIGGQGCFEYALSAAYSALSGDVHTVQECLYKQGFNPQINKSGTSITMSPAAGVGGTDVKVKQTLSGTNYELKSYEHNQRIDSIDTALNNGQVVMVHSTDATDSNGVLHTKRNGTGMHWTAIVGTTKSGDYIVLCNGSRKQVIPRNEMPDRYNTVVVLGPSK